MDKNKLGQIKLDPLSVDKTSAIPKSPKQSTFKKSFEQSTKQIVPSHLPGFPQNRPISEEISVPSSSKKTPLKQNIKISLKPISNNPRPKFTQTLQPTQSDPLEDFKSPGDKPSKLKQKFKTAKLTEMKFSHKVAEIPIRVTNRRPTQIENNDKEPVKLEKANILLLGELAKAKKFENPAIYDQKRRNLARDQEVDSEKNEGDETIKEMLPESSFITVHSSRVTKKTHSTHLSLSILLDLLMTLNPTSLTGDQS